MATIFTTNYNGSSGSYYDFKAEAYESEQSIPNNSHLVTVDIYLRRNKLSSNSAWNEIGTPWSITIEDETFSGSSTWDTRNTTEWIFIGSASKTVTHETDGSKIVSISASHTGNSSSGMDNASGSGTFELTTIPRYTNVYNSLKEKTLNTISINWSTTDARDWTQYSLNNGSWQDAYDTVASNQKSGYYTISNLSPNTKYTIKTRCRRTDSGLWSEAESLSISTYDIARISNLPNFEHGNNEIVAITNPSGVSLNLVMKVGDTQILNRAVVSGNNTISFGDKELDKLYKKYGSSDNLTATFIVSGSGYTNTKTCTVTLKGNQKTIKINNDGIYIRGKIWIIIAGILKKAIIWIKLQGTWKRGG